MLKQRNSGFTILELLVVFFIMAVMATLVLMNYRASEKKHALSQAAQQLVMNLRRAQNKAISGVGIAGQYYGYGVYIKQGDDFYIFYADVNGNDTYQPADDSLEIINLSHHIEIQSLSPLSNKVDVFFKPPQPTTYINGSDDVGDEAMVILQIKGDPSWTRTVKVTTAGLIQTQQ